MAEQMRLCKGNNARVLLIRAVKESGRSMGDITEEIPSYDRHALIR